MSQKNLYTLGWVLLTTVLLIACQAGPTFECTDVLGCVDIAPDEPLKLASAQALSGEVSTIGRDQLRGIELALADQENKLLGHPIELQNEDSLCLEEGGSTVAAKLASDSQVVGILGTTCSGAAVSASAIMSEAGLVMISGGNTAPSLTGVGATPGDNWQPGYFRTAYNDAIQGRAAATFAFNELGVTKAATVNDGDAYTQGLTEVFDQVFTELGGEITLSETINKGDTNMGPVLTGIADSGAEFIFLPIFQPEGDFIVRQSKEVEGLEDVTLMGADGLLVSTFVEAVGSTGVGMYFVGPDTSEDSAYQEFVSRYKSTYGEGLRTPFVANAYDATNILLKAIEAAAVQEDDGTLHIGRQALREAMAATAGFQGVTGRLTCDEFGDCGAPRYKVVRLDDPAAGIEALADNIIYKFAPAE